MNVATLFLLSLATMAPVDDLSPDARRDYARLERRLEADAERGDAGRVAASKRLLAAMRGGTSPEVYQHPADNRPHFPGTYVAHGSADSLTIHQDGRIECDALGPIDLDHTVPGSVVVGRTKAGDIVEMRAMPGGPGGAGEFVLAVMVSNKDGLPLGSAVYRKVNRPSPF